MTASIATRESEFSCSNCEQPIPFASALYMLSFDVRKLDGPLIDVLHAEGTAVLCPRCSLDFDLTKLDVPNIEGWYTEEPLDGMLTHVCQCALCRKEFVDGEQFESAFISPMDFPGEHDDPTVTISLCQPCSRKRSLRLAEPPSITCPPFCYECGKPIGFKGGYEVERELCLVHPSLKAVTLPKVRVCGACFFREGDDEP